MEVRMNLKMPENTLCEIVSRRDFAAELRQMGEQAPPFISAYNAVLRVQVPDNRYHLTAYENFRRDRDVKGKQLTPDFKMPLEHERPLLIAYFKADTQTLEALTRHSVIDGTREEQLKSDLADARTREDSGPGPFIT
jgi:hypothetical protein